MASKEKNTIRFAVGSKEDIHSSVWRLWATGGDLYLAARSMANISKISFHQSGINRFATNEKIKRMDNASDRVIHKWKRPPESVPGWTEGFGIVVPPRITRAPFKKHIEEKHVNFFPPPAQDRKVIFKILLSPKMSGAEDVRQLLTPREIKIHGRVETNRELAWLISFYDVFSPAERALVTGHFDKLKIHLKPGRTGSGIGQAFLHILEPGQLTFLVDVELGRENLETS